MKTIAPDFARRIDIPGTDSCSRPVDIDGAKTGFSKLVSLRVYAFDEGMTVDGEAEGDEVFIVLMRGRADIGVDQAGDHVGDFALGTDGGSRAVYLPPHAAYRLSAVADCDVAYARVQPSASSLPTVRGFAPVDNRLDIVGHATAMDLTLATLSAGDSFAVSGREGGLPERFVHVRSDGGGAAIMSGERVGDWGSALLDDGERATIDVEKGNIDILTVSASA